MTRKHFKLIASIIANLEINDNEKEYIAKRFVDKLNQESYIFDKEKFIDACKNKEL